MIYTFYSWEMSLQECGAVSDVGLLTTPDTPHEVDMTGPVITVGVTVHARPNLSET